MATYRDRPYPGFNFLVDLGDGESAGFLEVLMPAFAIDVIEYRSGNAKENSAVKLTGLEHSGNLVLKRGVNGSLDLYQWWDQVRNGDAQALRTVSVTLYNEDRSQLAMAWRFHRARPVKLAYAGFNALGQDIAIETLELAFERVEIE